MGIGPTLSKSLIQSVLEENISHLNLHANQLIHLNTSPLESTLVVLKHLTEMDVSSNRLGERSPKVQSYLQKDLCIGPSLLTLTPNLQYLNLSANNLNLASLSELFSVQTTRKNHDNVSTTSSIYLPNLVRLDLSHNRLTKLAPSILLCCPNLESLSLLNNRIKCIRDLLEPFYNSCNSASSKRGNTSSTEQQHHHHQQQNGNTSSSCTERMKYLFLQNDNWNTSNPICNIRNYRNRIINSFPSLIQLDGKEVTHSEPEQKGDDISEPSSYRSTERSPKKITRRHLKQTRSKNTQDGIKKTGSTTNINREDRIKRATENISLHKLNQISDEVRALSKIAGEQAEVTQMLLDAHAHQKNQDHDMSVDDDESEHGHYFTKNRKRSKIRMISDSQVQTSFMYDSLSETSSSSPPSPPSRPGQDTNVDVGILEDFNEKKYLILHLAVEKWRKNFLCKKMIESQEDSKKQFAIEICTIRQEHKTKLEQLKNRIASKDTELKEMENKISILNTDSIKRGKEKEAKLGKKHRRELQRIARMAEDELERAQRKYCQQIDQERDRADMIIQQCNERLEHASICNAASKQEMQKVQTSLQDERNKNLILVNQLQSHQDTSLQELKNAEIFQTKVNDPSSPFDVLKYHLTIFTKTLEISMKES